MIGQRALPLLAAALLAACSQSESEEARDAGNEPISGKISDSMIGDGTAFNAAFDRSFEASCVASATGAGAPEAVSREVCACGVRELNAQYTAPEKAKLTPDQLSAVMRLCADKVMNTNG